MEIIICVQGISVVSIDLLPSETQVRLGKYILTIHLYVLNVKHNAYFMHNITVQYPTIYFL